MRAERWHCRSEGCGMRGSGLRCGKGSGLRAPWDAENLSAESAGPQQRGSADGVVLTKYCKGTFHGERQNATFCCGYRYLRSQLAWTDDLDEGGVELGFCRSRSML